MATDDSVNPRAYPLADPNLPSQVSVYFKNQNEFDWYGAVQLLREALRPVQNFLSNNVIYGCYLELKHGLILAYIMHFRLVHIME